MAPEVLSFAAHCLHVQQVVKTREGDVLLQVCNNAKCRRREDRPFQFERCSQCQAAFYCGPLCQEEDWFVGHHWRRCKAPKSGGQTSKFIFTSDRSILNLIFLQVLTKMHVRLQKRSNPFCPEICEILFRPIMLMDDVLISFAGRRLVEITAKFWFAPRMHAIMQAVILTNFSG